MSPFQLKADAGHSIRLRLTPYNSEDHLFLFPESVGMSLLETGPSSTREPWNCWGAHTLLRFDRQRSGRFILNQEGWWERSEETAQCRCTARLKENDDGLRLDLEFEITNRTDQHWRAAGVNPCLGLLPAAWQDPGLRRMYTVTKEADLQILGDLVAGNKCNVISMHEGPKIERDETMVNLPEWLIQDLRLKEPLLMTQAADGRYTLVIAFERACSLATGYGGPCMHVIAQTDALPGGSSTKVRGMIALVQGDALQGLDYYRQWKKEFTNPKHP